MEIKIKYFDEGLEKIKKIGGKSDWYDLRAADRHEIKAGEFCMIPLGIAMDLPEGYEAHVVPRSSTFKNYGILMVNSIGIIDNSYNGDEDQWHFPAYATRDTVVEKGDRICQFRIEKNQPDFDFVEVEHLNKVNRGGFGSTGTK